MGSSRSTLLPAPDDRLLKSIKILELSNTDLAKVRSLGHPEVLVYTKEYSLVRIALHDLCRPYIYAYM